MPRQSAQRDDRFSAEEFFDMYEEHEPQPYVDGSLAVEVDMPTETPVKKEPVRKEKAHKENKTSAKKKAWQLRKAGSMARIKSKFNFFLCAGLVMAGCLSVVLMYIQVFSQEAQISDLQTQLAQAQEANAIAQNTVGSQMTMTELYGYATGTLGMVEANGKTIIDVTIQNQSYTTSTLPIEDVSESKVSFHWFG